VVRPRLFLYPFKRGISLVKWGGVWIWAGLWVRRRGTPVSLLLPTFSASWRVYGKTFIVKKSRDGLAGLGKAVYGVLRWGRGRGANAGRFFGILGYGFRGHGKARPNRASDSTMEETWAGGGFRKEGLSRKREAHCGGSKVEAVLRRFFYQSGERTLGRGLGANLSRAPLLALFKRGGSLENWSIRPCKAVKPRGGKIRGTAREGKGQDDKLLKVPQGKPCRG